MIKQFITAAVIAVSAAAAGTAFAQSGFGPAPHYDPLAAAPESQHGISAQSIASHNSDEQKQGYGGMRDTVSQSGGSASNGVTAGDPAGLFAHH